MSAEYVRVSFVHALHMCTLEPAAGMMWLGFGISLLPGFETMLRRVEIT